MLGSDERGQTRSLESLICRSTFTTTSVVIIGVGARDFVSRVRRHVLPHLVLVKPYGVGVSPDELIRVHSLNLIATADPFLLAVHKDEHELRVATSSCRLLCMAEFALLLRHQDVMVTLTAYGSAAEISAAPLAARWRLSFESSTPAEGGRKMTSDP